MNFSKKTVLWLVFAAVVLMFQSCNLLRPGLLGDGDLETAYGGGQWLSDFSQVINNDGSVTLSWTSGFHDRVTYDIYIGTRESAVESSDPSVRQGRPYTSSESSHSRKVTIDNGFQLGTTYYWKVEPSQSQSQGGADFSAVTSSVQYFTVPSRWVPSNQVTVSNLDANPDLASSGLSLRWTASPSGVETTYTIYIGLDEGVVENAGGQGQSYYTTQGQGYYTLSYTSSEADVSRVFFVSPSDFGMTAFPPSGTIVYWKVVPDKGAASRVASFVIPSPQGPYSLSSEGPYPDTF